MIEHTLANLIQELAYLITGLVICFIGKGLLEKGITGQFSGEGELASKKFRIVTSSPGLVFLIAGLIIVVMAINKQSRLPIVGSKPQDNCIQDLDSLKKTAQLFPVAIYATKDDEATLAELHYQNALDRASEGAMNATKDHLLRAIALIPGLLQKAINEPAFDKIFEDNNFIAAVNTHMKIASAALKEAPLPSMFRSAIASLTIFGMNRDSKMSSEEIQKLVESLPPTEGVEPTERTIESLKNLLKNDPKTLAKILSQPQYRWFAMNPKIRNWVASIADRPLESLDNSLKDK